MEKKRLTQGQAAKALSGIQSKNRTVRKQLCGTRVAVTPLSGNAFEITLGMSLPGADRAAGRLRDVHADIDADGRRMTAVVTWDTALHYLAMTGDLD